MTKFGESLVLFRSSSTHKKVGLGSLRNGGGRGGKEEATEFNQEKGRGPWGHMMCCCSYVEGMCHSHQELGAPDAAAHALLSHTYFPSSSALIWSHTRHAQKSCRRRLFGHYLRKRPPFPLPPSHQQDGHIFRSLSFSFPTYLSK